MIEQLARAAINRLKVNYKLPSEGFLAGGSLANTIWELRTGTKAVINDIDIFIFDKKIDLSDAEVKNDRFNKLFTWTKAEVNITENPKYGHVLYRNKFGSYYRINSADRDGLINNIFYESNKTDYSIIIESFDINCTQVGYDLKEDKFHYSKNFEEFIENGELKAVNANTPAHTALRLVKKSKELKTSLDKDVEFSYLGIALMNKSHIHDVIRSKFTDKYLELYKENQEDLVKYFGLNVDNNTSRYIKHKNGQDIQIFELYLSLKFQMELEKKYKGVGNIATLDNLNFYYRDISQDPKKIEIFSRIPKLYSKLENYIDIDIDISKIDILERIERYAPVAASRLYGLKISEQIKIVKSIFTRYAKDPILAGSILEKIKIDPSKDLDDDDILLMELMVRKDERNNTEMQRFKYLISDKPSSSTDYDFNELFAKEDI
jgi:hypothetical protein